jgi:hypothetical protein
MINKRMLKDLIRVWDFFVPLLGKPAQTEGGVALATIG